MLIDDRDGVRLLIRWRAGEQMKSVSGQGILIGSPIQLLPHQLFGGGVGHGQLPREFFQRSSVSRDSGHCAFVPCCDKVPFAASRPASTLATWLPRYKPPPGAYMQRLNG